MNIEQKSLSWWDGLPMQDIRDCRNGWANLVMFYYPHKTNCQDVTNEEIIHMYVHEHKSELRKEKIDKIKNRNLVECYCMGCGKTFLGEKPRMCCSGRDCGCMGLPIEPVVCSSECYDKIINKYKNK